MLVESNVSTQGHYYVLFPQPFSVWQNNTARSRRPEVEAHGKGCDDTGGTSDTTEWVDTNSTAVWLKLKSLSTGEAGNLQDMLLEYDMLSSTALRYLIFVIQNKCKLKSSELS